MNSTKSASVRWPLVSPQLDIQARYEEMRERGESHMMAEMLAYQRAPSCDTDTTLFAGKLSLADQFKHDPDHLEVLVKKAKARGISVNPTDQYVPQLASEPLDPTAIIAHSDGKSKIKKLCEMQGVDCHGQVKVKAYRPEEPKMMKLHPKLVERAVDQMITRDPGLAHKDRQQLREKAVHEQGFHSQAAPRKPVRG